jgi:mannose-1-phosphate guanylyltransferase
MNLVAVIMAGGSGTRFWPLSRSSRPKQFLPIAGEKTMLEDTVARLQPLIPLKKIYTVSNASQAETIRKLVPQLPPSNCLIEPEGRNTAPSLILATAQIFLRDPEAVVAALPADHVILKPEVFRRKLKAAAAAAQRGFLITFGIPPTYPATGYGYIHFEAAKSYSFLKETFYPVLAFKEKPTREQAETFLEAGHYYWNSGMFLWRADVLPQKLRAYAPDWLPFWEKIVRALKKEAADEVASIFRQMPVLSIDYALMERAKEILVCPGDFGWSDVGVWSSLLELWPRDKAGNACRGEVMSLDSERCLVYNPGQITAIIGVEDLIIVNSGDALLVCRREADQKIREIIAQLKKAGKTEYL